MNAVPQLIAGGNIYPSRFVRLSTSADFTLLQSGANELALGVSQEGKREAPIPNASGYAAVAGDSLKIYVDGDVCLVEAGDTIVAGDRLKADAYGAAVPIASTGTTVQNIGAQALQGAAAGELFLVKVSALRSLRPALT